MRKYFLISFIAFAVIINAQNRKTRLELFPAGLHLLPLKASFEEPHFGTMLYLNNLNLKVDIGNSIDIIKFNRNNNDIITIGIDFMAYALANSYAGHRLQIDAVDGFFGGNLSYSSGKMQNKSLFRFRYVHNSSHLVDGHYDLELNKWVNNKKPIPFTRNYFEILVGKETLIYSAYLKYYAQFNYSILVRPSQLRRIAAGIGFELGLPGITPKLFNQSTFPFLAFHTSLKGIPQYNFNSNIMLGIKIGKWYGKGVNFYFSYYSGKNFFNEYFKNSIHLFSFGFLIDYL